MPSTNQMGMSAPDTMCAMHRIFFWPAASSAPFRSWRACASVIAGAGRSIHAADSQCFSTGYTAARLLTLLDTRDSVLVHPGLGQRLRLTWLTELTRKQLV